MTRQGLLVLALLFLLFSCKSHREVTRETSRENLEVVYIDSVVIHDSVVVVPVERYVDIVREYDTLTLETSQAVAQCWVDSAWLRGTIENKQAVQYKYVDRWHVRDSLIYDTLTRLDVTYVDRVVEKVVEKQNPLNRLTLTISVIFIILTLLCVLRRFLK